MAACREQEGPFPTLREECFTHISPWPQPCCMREACSRSLPTPDWATGEGDTCDPERHLSLLTVA